MPDDAPAEAEATQSHVLLLADWDPMRAGKVLLADPSLISRLQAESIAFRVATKREREIAGFAE